VIQTNFQPSTFGLYLHMKKIFLFILLSSFVISCSPSDQELEVKTFFDLAGLIDKEIEYLKDKKPEVSKNVKINDDFEKIKSKEIDWVKELEILKLSDLNKAAFKLSYDMIENDSLISYKLKEEEKQPIESLILHKNKEGKISQIESIHSTYNYLYSSKKTITAKLENSHLKSYSLKGWQELFIGSRKNFEISGEIL
jgi:hypothetical protein